MNEFMQYHERMLSLDHKRVGKNNMNEKIGGISYSAYLVRQ